MSSGGPKSSRSASRPNTSHVVEREITARGRLRSATVEDADGVVELGDRVHDPPALAGEAGRRHVVDVRRLPDREAAAGRQRIDDRRSEVAVAEVLRRGASSDGPGDGPAHPRPGRPRHGRTAGAATSSLAIFSTPYRLIGFGGVSSAAGPCVPSNTQSVETRIRVAPTSSAASHEHLGGPDVRPPCEVVGRRTSGRGR